MIDDATKVVPESTAPIYARLIYSWLNPLLKKGNKQVLEMSDLWRLDKRFTCAELSDRLDKAWKRELNRPTGEGSSPSMRLLRAAFDAFGRQYIAASALLFAYISLQLVSAVVFLYLLRWVQSEPHRNPGVWYGYVLGVVLFVMQLLGTACFNWHLEMTTKLGFQLRSSLTAAIYKKAFMISNDAKKDYTSGKITNLTATDTNRIDVCCLYNQYLWAAPTQIVGGFGLLVWILGPSALVGCGIIALYIPFQIRLIKVLGGYRRGANVFMDQRVKTIQEILLGIRAVKVYAWETSFSKKVADIRALELSQIRGFLFSRAVVNGVTQIIPTLAMMASFACYTLIGHRMDPAVAFASLQLFYTIKMPMSYLPMVLIQAVDALTGLGRIGSFLLAPELESEAVRLPYSNNDSESAIEVTNASFTWRHSSAPPKLLVSDAMETKTFEFVDLSLSIPTGKLVAVVGKVGSGKSSLLNALVGEMTKTSGVLTFRGSVGYCQQQAWIQNATIKENILFGAKYNSEKYQEVIRVCSLDRDFSVLPNGDETEIGERGINLSGGQKQRVQIARAVYFDPDIFLFDDPLSAVDSHVSRALFDDCILGKLAGKTRVLVTHQLHFLPRVDQIILIENGRVIAQDTYENLLSCNSNFFELMQEFGGLEHEHTSPETSTPTAASQSEKAGIRIEDETSKDALGTKPSRGIMMVEERNAGAVQLKYYVKYLGFCGGLLAGLSIFWSVSFAQASRVMTDQWLVYWTNLKFPLSTAQYIGIYAGLCLVQGLLIGAFGLILAYCGTLGSYNMHKEALTSILNSPLSFFDATPLGRITSRFSRDCDGIDNQLQLQLYQIIITTFVVFSNFILIGIDIPAFFGPMVIIMGGYYGIQVYYRKTARELKRLDSISRSPLLANVSESITGLATIRAYGAKERFIARNASLMDNNNRAYYPALLIQRWIQLRIEALNAFLVLATSLFVILFEGNFSPEVAGLVLVYVSQSTMFLTALVRQSADAELNMNSAERIIHYIDELDSEMEPSNAEIVVSDSWPARGEVIVKNLVLKYREDLPAVLKEVSFRVPAGSKVGIVGRTGAGKSSILMALLRLFEYESGTIEVDGIELKSLPLRKLRNRIGVIPQEPVLFSGSIRSNLDPFSEYTDLQLWDALERADLRKTIEATSGGLDASVTENGANWSTGQRQLICLARAILKKPKLLLLDEATASVDLETDELIQKAIRSHFAESTVLTIAHRLNTIADYDSILVLGSGVVLEYGSPMQLLSLQDSHFSKMVLETGAQNAALIMQLAKK